MVILDDSWFMMNSGNYELKLDQVAALINLTELIRHFRLFLVDYGYFEIISTCAPYSEQAFSTQRPIIIQNLITHQYKKIIPTFSKYQNISTSFDKCLDYLMNKYIGREIVVATCNKKSGFEVHKNKMIYFWNPYEHDNKIIKRQFVQSNKHKYRRPNEEQTFCPIPDQELNCALQRAISFSDYNSFHDERFEICSYHEKYGLIIKNKYTTDTITEIPNNFAFSYQRLPLTIQAIEYHGFQFDSSTDEGQRICQLLFKSSMPVDLDIIKSREEYLKREREMLRELA
ncbi:hypothetical protein HQN90_37680 [Paenibacillus alba]|uniref:hypothetical protein n=1 Tax=Paenibacillus alba TaxID=1197127 RepID=UPI0015646CDF|nr:hypothetical protein [Paenibacillus alba]NQX71807.1 hypothetical protein [Paenibacillus alba]